MSSSLEATQQQETMPSVRSVDPNQSCTEGSKQETLRASGSDRSRMPRRQSPLAAALVSVIIPVRNDAERLGRCLASIVRGTYPADCVEIVVVDNGSSDDTAEVATTIGATVVSRSEGTVAELRNFGARYAQGTVLAFIDADHEIDRSWIWNAADHLASERVAVVGAPCHAPEDGTWVQRMYDGLRQRRKHPSDVIWLGSGNMAVKRDVFEDVGGFDGSLESCEDVEFCHRVRRRGFRILQDDCLKSVHFGDPATLRAVFLGELWRGRDNLIVSLRRPLTLRELPSIVIPCAELCLIGLFIVSLVVAPISGLLPVAAVAEVLLALVFLRAGVLFLRCPRTTVVSFAQAFLVAFVYDVARALALVVRGTHRGRRMFG